MTQRKEILKNRTERERERESVRERDQRENTLSDIHLFSFHPEGKLILSHPEAAFESRPRQSAVMD